MLRCGFVWLWLLLSFVPVVLAVDPGDEEITRLVKQLGNDAHFEREAASKRLAEIGEPALDALRRAKTSDEPEVRMRAEQIFAAIVADVDNKLYGPELCLTGHNVCSVCVSPDGKRLLTNGEETLRLWDTYTGQQLHVFEGQVCGAEFSPDGKSILSAASHDRTLRILEVETGRELKRITDANVFCATFSPDGKRIASGGYHDQAVRLWDTQTGKELRQYEGHTSYVSGVTIFPDGKRIASTSGDGTVCIWRAPRRPFSQGADHVRFA